MSTEQFTQLSQLFVMSHGDGAPDELDELAAMDEPDEPDELLEAATEATVTLAIVVDKPEPPCPIPPVPPAPPTPGESTTTFAPQPRAIVVRSPNQNGEESFFIIGAESTRRPVAGRASGLRRPRAIHFPNTIVEVSHDSWRRRSAVS